MPNKSYNNTLLYNVALTDTLPGYVPIYSTRIAPLSTNLAIQVHINKLYLKVFIVLRLGREVKYLKNGVGEILWSLEPRGRRLR